MACKSGQAQANIGQTTCEDCAAGERSSPNPSSGSIGAQECVDCDRGKYQNHADRAGTSTSHTCLDCEKGKFQDQTKQDTCKDCPKGQFQPVPSDGAYDALSCKSCATVVPKGKKYQDQVGQENCKECGAGERANPGSQACSTCENYQFMSASNDCTQCQGCPAGEFNPTGCPGTTQGGCASCPNGFYKSEDDSALVNEWTMTINAQDIVASKGAAVTQNSATGTLKLKLDGSTTTVVIECEDGVTFSDSAALTVNSVVVNSGDITNAANPRTNYNRGCTACSKCLTGTYRPSEDACRLQKSTTHSSCTDCPQGYYSLVTLEWDKYCNRCEDCKVGKERINCATNYEGTSRPWPAPVIQSVTGPGTDGGITNGGEQITITGTNFVHRRGGDAVGSGTSLLVPSTKDILVQYGGPASNSATPVYYLDNCVLVLPCGLGDVCDINCLTIEGVGANLPIKIQIFEDAARGNAAWSDSFTSGNGVTYSAPLISEYGGTGADRIASTVGSETLIIKGANFGPPCPKPCPWITKAELVELVEEGTNRRRRRLGEDGRIGEDGRRLPSSTTTTTDPKVYVMDHTKCEVFSHTKMSCEMPEGAGKAYKVVLTIAGLFSVETQMSYAPPTIDRLEDSSGSPITTIGTRGSDLVVLVGTNFPNTKSELDLVRFGSSQSGFSTYGVVDDALSFTLSAPGTCQVLVAGISIRCLTLPGVLMGHGWQVTVGGLTSTVGATTSYREPTIDTVEVEIVGDRVVGQLSLFPTRGATAIIRGTNFGVGLSGLVVPGATVKIVLYPRGDVKSPVEKAVDVLPLDGSKDVLRFTMPEGYGTGWRLALKISTVGVPNPDAYAAWPSPSQIISAGGTVNFGYQVPTILFTDTTNTLPNNLQIEIVGTNFCTDKSCAQVWICQSGQGNPDPLCFAGGSRANGPHSTAVLMDESNVATWDHTTIKITPQDLRSYDKRYVFVMVGGSVADGGEASNPAFQSSTNPEVREICRGTSPCNAYPNLKAPGQYPTNGKDSGGQSIVLSILASEANLVSSDDPPWDSMRISVGSTTVRPTKQLITNAVENIDCEDDAGGTISCTRFTFTLPSTGWTGLNQPVTLWIATIKSNNALIDFEPPRITGIFKTGTQNPIDGVPTGGTSSGLNDVNRKFDIVGTNFGSSSVLNAFELQFKSTETNVAQPLLVQPSSIPSKCDLYDHNILTGCRFPEGQGSNYVVTMTSFGHPEQTFPSDQTKLIKYYPPTVESLTPDHGSTIGGYKITVVGKNMGLEKPSVTFGGVPVVVSHVDRRRRLTSGGFHDTLTFEVPPGQGDSVDVVVTAGGQLSNSFTFTYDSPTLSTLSPNDAETDGRDINDGRRVKAIMKGSNFGTETNTDLSIVFSTKGENPERTFVVPREDILNVTNHDTLVFYVPPGYGKTVEVTVNVAGKKAGVSLPFRYHEPTVEIISMDCSGYDDLVKEFVTGANLCYGYRPEARAHPRMYPTINKMTIHNDFTATIDYDYSKDEDGKTYPFGPSTGSSVVVQGMPVKESQQLNLNYIVHNESLPGASATSLRVQLPYDAVLKPGTYSAPAASNEARIGVSYISSISAGFRLMETDACGAQASSENLRSSGLEPFERWQERNDQAGASSAAQALPRECKQASIDRRQRIIVVGNNFGKDATAPITVTLQSKTCDCTEHLDGTLAPCRSEQNAVCSSKSSDGKCPVGTKDCSLENVDGALISLDVEYHGENRLVVPVVPGFGRHHELQVTVGTVPATPVVMRYHRPTVDSWVSEGSLTGESNILKPDGASRLCYLGNNFGQGTAEVMEKLIEIRIGSEYDIDGLPSDDLDVTMPLCGDLTWYESLTSGSDDFKGTPAICCTIPVGTVGARNHSIIINGQRDDCTTNSMLCAFPYNWPIDRKERRVSKEEFQDMLKDGSGSPLFSCGRKSETLVAQAYGNVGELCLDVNSNVTSGTCEDAECTKPRALAGFFRLDLDLEFACKSGTTTPCQKDVIVSEYNSIKTEVDNRELCFEPSLVENGMLANATGAVVACEEGQFQCSNKGSNAVAPGECVFRRPKEAQRALGNSYAPWSKDDTISQDRVKSLEPRCHERRFEHLMDPTIYDKYPGLQQSPTCYDIVACNPKDSCTGNNQCKFEYRWMKNSCDMWQMDHPRANDCSSDDDCRTRSGTSSSGAFGLTSACSRDHPEDCARCDLSGTTPDPLTGKRAGKCVCVGGAPRCGLCTQRVTFNDTDWRRDHANYTKFNKGYFRLNNECEPCPENPLLIIIGIVCLLILGSIAAWWLQRKKINISIMTIGFDYFQVLAIFARINVKWPPWVKSLLELASFLNFNIDIAGPECAFPKFDYKIKWIVTVVTPFMFGFLLFLIFLLLMCWKFIQKICSLKSGTPKYFSHGPRLLATYLLIMYCLYLSVVRRALDIFNCNPPDPPDGYLYTEFVSEECEAGICKCGDADELQAQLVPWAALIVVVVAIGFPLYVFYLTWYYRVQMKMDQLLRAHGLGDSRATSVDGTVTVGKRCCRSHAKETYSMRKKYNMLYYHFKPGKVYWMFVILVRKFLVAMCALMFRANVGFMLSVMLLILFLNYVLVIKHRPFMSNMERFRVINQHTRKAAEAEDRIDRGKLTTEISPEALLHLDIKNVISNLKAKLEAAGKNNETSKHTKNVKSLDGLAKSTNQSISEKDLKARDRAYYFDYNTLDQVLIACAIFLCVIGLMFQSSQFYLTNPIKCTAACIADGVLDDCNNIIECLDPDAWIFYNAVLVASGFVLFGSIIYYGIVFATEMAGCSPAWVRKLFATKKSRQEKHAAMLAAQNEKNRGDGDIEMHSNPLGAGAGMTDDLTGARKKADDAAYERKRMQSELAGLEATQGAMNEEYRRLKAQAARGVMEGKNDRTRNRTNRSKAKKRAFDPRHVTDDFEADDMDSFPETLGGNNT